MVQNPLTFGSKLKPIAKKACFGTKEWSKNSGICNRCNYKEECGKVDAKRRA